VFRDDLAEDCDCVGRFSPSRNRIEHEAAHAIATHMGMDELNADEEKIDKLGQGIAQILRTKRNK
jgi:hypothetical protein